MTTEPLALAAAALAAAALRTAWLLARGERLPLGYLLKALPMLGAIALLWLNPGPDQSYAGLIMAGLCVSLAGDMLIIHDRLFKAALLAFLAAHLCYALAFAGKWVEMFGAFRGTYMAPHAVAPVTGLIIGASFLAALAVYRRLAPGLGTALRGPVAAYMTAIMAMACLATLGFSAHWDQPSALAALGAWLFVTSDAVLGLDRFAAAFQGRTWLRELAVGPCYFSGQVLIACSAAIG